MLLIVFLKELLLKMSISEKKCTDNKNRDENSPRFRRFSLSLLNISAAKSVRFEQFHMSIFVVFLIGLRGFILKKPCSHLCRKSMQNYPACKDMGRSREGGGGGGGGDG